MKKYYFVALAAIAALSSCSIESDPLENESGNQALVFTAVMESAATRATLNDLTPSWEAGDEISINGKIYQADNAGTSTTFTAVSEEASGASYQAYYPSQLSAGTLPAVQTYEDGKFNMPMYAMSNTTDLSFKNICAVLAVKVTSADIRILKSIKVSSDKAMYGDFTVTDNKAVLADASDATKDVELVCASPLALDEDGTVFYIAIPAQEYKYINIFLSADGTSYIQAMGTKKAAGLGAIARNNIFNIDYAVNAVKLYDGPFFALSNVGATKPEEYGLYFSWGNVDGQAIDADKKFATPFTEAAYNSTTGAALTTDIPADAAYDAAIAYWGENWRMPTYTNFQNLKTNCTTGFSVNDGVYGYNIIGKDDYNTNSIFLPGAGYADDSSVNLNYDNDSGNYWTSKYSGDGAIRYYFCFYSSANIHLTGGRINAYRGHTIRPVLVD